MEKVEFMLYWGGCIMREPVGGVSYSLPPRLVYSVPRGTKLSELLSILRPKVVKDGENVNLKLVCRYPISRWETTINYTIFPIEDDMALEGVLNIPSNFPFILCVEIYVEKEPLDYVHDCQGEQDQYPSQSACSRVEPSLGVQPFSQPHASLPPIRQCMDVTQPKQYDDQASMCPLVQHVRPADGTSVNEGADVDSLANELEFDKDVDVALMDSPEKNGDNIGGKGSVSGEVQKLHTPIPSFTELKCDDDHDTCSINERKHRYKVWSEENPKLEIRMTFKNKNALMNCVKFYHMKENREFVVVETTPSLWSLQCKHRCRWRLRASKKKSHGFFEITRYDGDHNCASSRSNQDNCNLDSSFIATLILGLVKDNPELKVSVIMENIKKNQERTISYRKAWLARSKAIEMLYGDWDVSYKKLPKYLHALRTLNPGTVVEWEGCPANASNEVTLNKLFWAFKPSIDGFVHCPPVICIYSTDIHGKYLGKMLMAIGTTSANTVFPLAFAIVDDENLESWTWFIRNLRQHVVPGRESLALISDPQCAILSVSDSLWEYPLEGPRGYHRYSLEHFCNNFDEKFKNPALKALVLEAANTNHVCKLNRIVEEIGNLNLDAKRWLMHQPLEKWTRAHDGGRRWGVMTINYADVFNNILKGIRNIPITGRVENTFYGLVKYFDCARVEAEKDISQGMRYTKHVQDKILGYQAKANAYNCISLSREEGIFEVTKGSNKKRVVQRHGPSCSCGKWQIYKYPCQHMLVLSIELGLDPFSLVAKEYTMDVYRRTWESMFQPLGHEDYWSKPPPEFPVMLPDPTRIRVVKLGRPKHAHIHDVMDV